VATGFVMNPFIYAGFNRRDKEMVNSFCGVLIPVAAVFDCRLEIYKKGILDMAWKKRRGKNRQNRSFVGAQTTFYSVVLCLVCSREATTG